VAGWQAENDEAFLVLLLRAKCAGRYVGPAAAMEHYAEQAAAGRDRPLLADVRSIHYLPDGRLTAEVPPRTVHARGHACHQHAQAARIA
jgi:hypothetical protein